MTKIQLNKRICFKSIMRQIFQRFLFVVPAKAGTQRWDKPQRKSIFSWIPACAGMTKAQVNGYAIFSKYIITVLFCLVVFCAHASAATVTATPKDSTVMFRINHDLGYTVGYFNDFTAALETGDDPAQVVSAKIQVATSSINTRNAVRDEGLKSALFLDSEKFPQATFESATVENDAISGTLTLKGVSKPVTFKIERLEGKVLLRTTINRSDFGVTYNKVLADKKKSIGEAVDLIIELKV